MLDLFKNCINLAVFALAIVAELILFCMTLVITANVFGRYLLDTPVLFAPEISGYSLVAIVCLALAYTQKVDGHIEITFITRLFSPTVQKWLSSFVLVVSIVFMIWLTYTTAVPVVYHFEHGGRAIGNLSIPLWILYSSVPLGFGGLTLELIRESIQKLS